MSSLARLTLGRLVPACTGGGVTIPSLIDALVAAPMSAMVATPALVAQVNQGLVISVAETILAANVQSPVTVEVNTIIVEVDIC